MSVTQTKTIIYKNTNAPDFVVKEIEKLSNDAIINAVGFMKFAPHGFYQDISHDGWFVTYKDSKGSKGVIKRGSTVMPIDEISGIFIEALIADPHDASQNEPLMIIRVRGHNPLACPGYPVPQEKCENCNGNGCWECNYEG